MSYYRLVCEGATTPQGPLVGGECPAGYSSVWQEAGPSVLPLSEADADGLLVAAIVVMFVAFLFRLAFRQLFSKG